MKRLSLILLLLSVPALAQQPPAGPPPSPEAQALGGKLAEEYNANLQLRAQVITLQQQNKMLAEENAKLKAATKAEAPKPPEPPKK